MPAYCFTVIHGVPAEDVITRLGGDPGWPLRLTFEECFWLPGADQCLQVDAVADGRARAEPRGTWQAGGDVRAAWHHSPVLIAEHNCWRANEDETAARLSYGGRLVSFSTDVTAVMRFVYAVDGVVITAFDPLLDRRPLEGEDPRALDHLLADLRFGVEDAGAAAMTLLERATGLRVTRSWLARRQRAARLPALI